MEGMKDLGYGALSRRRGALRTYLLIMRLDDDDINSAGQSGGVDPRILSSAPSRFGQLTVVVRSGEVLHDALLAPAG